MRRLLALLLLVVTAAACNTGPSAGSTITLRSNLVGAKEKSGLDELNRSNDRVSLATAMIMRGEVFLLKAGTQVSIIESGDPSKIRVLDGPVVGQTGWVNASDLTR